MLLSCDTFASPDLGPQTAGAQIGECKNSRPDDSRIKLPNESPTYPLSPNRLCGAESSTLIPVSSSEVLGREISEKFSHKTARKPIQNAPQNRRRCRGSDSTRSGSPDLRRSPSAACLLYRTPDSFCGIHCSLEETRSAARRLPRRRTLSDVTRPLLGEYDLLDVAPCSAERDRSSALTRGHRRARWSAGQCLAVWPVKTSRPLARPPEHPPRARQTAMEQRVFPTPARPRRPVARHCV